MSFHQQPGTVSICFPVPDDTPNHTNPSYPVSRQMVCPAGGSILVTTEPGGGWRAEVECRGVKKDGSTSQVAVYVHFSYPTFRAGEVVPRYVQEAAERARHMQRLMFAGTKLGG